jgi:hypothetical protein
MDWRVRERAVIVSCRHASASIPVYPTTANMTALEDKSVLRDPGLVPRSFV